MNEHTQSRPRRRRLTLTERYASVILDLKRGNGTPFIERERAKHLTAGEIVEEFEARIQFDHVVPVAIDGSNHPTNVTAMETARHREKTSRRDIPQIAKSKRIARSRARHETAMAGKANHAPGVAKMNAKARSVWPTQRAMAGSRSNSLKKKLNGRVEQRQR